MWKPLSGEKKWSRHVRVSICFSSQAFQMPDANPETFLEAVVKTRAKLKDTRAAERTAQSKPARFPSTMIVRRQQRLDSHFKIHAI
jgi:hypothetical protein